MPECIPDVPYGRVRLGKISDDTADAYIAFYEAIKRGEKEGAVTFRKLLSGGWRWITERSTTIFDEDGKPVSAIISYSDVTEQQEKELVYKRWQQSMEGKDPKSYALFQCNLTRNASYDVWEGELLSVRFDDSMKTFNDRTIAYADQRVYEGDRERYIAFVNSNTMLAEYYRSHRSDSLEYRERMDDGSIRWLKLTVDLVEVPHSTDVEAYLLYENIDDLKKAELEAVHMAQTDPLTGLLNRKAFAQRVNEWIAQSKPGTRHAFMMLDIDGFKLLNDTFGHAAGDEALIEAANKLQGLLRKGDLLGRLGGDEFVLFLGNVSSKTSLEAKADQICRKLFKTYSAQIELTASIGICIYPKDGKDSHALYEKADIALYAAKESGRNTYRIYAPDMPEKGAGTDNHAMTPSEAGKTVARQKRRILIVDTEKENLETLKALLSGDFLVDAVSDRQSALTRMRYYGSALSAVLLDTRAQGMDGMEILRHIRSMPEMRGVPVIVMSGAEDREGTLLAVRNGATDFVTKPLNAELVRLRIDAAVSRAENERLRAQNSFLKENGNEISRYRTALHDMGMFVVEMDWLRGTFEYDAAISDHLKGAYDGRTLWQILLCDHVANAKDVEKAQAFVRALAVDPERTDGNIEMRLTTREDVKHRFALHVTKVTGAQGETARLLLTFKDEERAAVED